MKIASICLMLVLSFAARGELRVGGLLGARINTPTASGSVFTYNNQSSGSQVGALVWYSVMDIIALRSGLIYADKTSGGKVDITSVSGNSIVTTSDFKTKLIYVDIPLNVEVSLPLTGLYVFGGLKYSYLNTSNCEISSTQGATLCQVSFKTTTYVYNGGVGYAFDFKLFKVGGEIEHEVGRDNFSNDTPFFQMKAWNFNAVVSFPVL